ncbi:DASH complex subunit Dad2-domain-containing protein [Fusarium acuminatum]|uniref:DASH complex subunit DAD2 n=1 Tax=Fusarium acuminatum TaxID=5515 RepID=A0ABZ2WFV8_9HYPO
MSYPTRPISSHMRAPSASSSSAGQSPALLARIEEKKAELENLKELRELSAAVATQMEALEQRLSTLSDGTEAKLAKTASDPTQAPEDSTGPLPQTLVRIPTEHAPALQAQAEAAEAAAEEEES